ncbi:hypothetical protein scyTo_0022663 [Scyliorhinus torazame]|uniref:Uncharacterized protein n=1 Tax=Scyliorhinus torazame TaxID=75743 RepID=A0A401QAR0_SCYTO|nr:hypothetical protein [Scyliorhinus torazame]
MAVFPSFTRPPHVLFFQKKFAMIFNFISAVAGALAAVIYIISTMMSRAGTAIYISRAPMLILALLFLYCVVELIIALLCGIILCKN